MADLSEFYRRGDRNCAKQISEMDQLVSKATDAMVNGDLHPDDWQELQRIVDLMIANKEMQVMDRFIALFAAIGIREVGRRMWQDDT